MYHYDNYTYNSYLNNQRQAEVEKPVLVNCFNTLSKLLTSKPIKELEFTEYAWAKIKTYITIIGDYEISGFGRIQDGKITDIKILKQVVESAHAMSDEDAVMEFIMSLPKEQINEWCLDWHSHVKMAMVSPSTTDIENYNLMSKAKMGKPFPAIILTQNNAINCFTYFGDGIYKNTNIIVPEMHNLTTEQYKEIYDECSGEVMEKCEIKTYYTYNYGNYGYGNYNKKKDNDTKEINSRSVNLCQICQTSLTTQEEEANGLYCDECLLGYQDYEPTDNVQQYENKNCLVCGAILSQEELFHNGSYCDDCCQYKCIVCGKIPEDIDNYATCNNCLAN